MAHAIPNSIEQMQSLLLSGNYIADRETATILFLALTLKRPLFIEGEPGTGKTEIAKVLSATLGRPLHRVQCYEGLDLSSAAYEWNFTAQITAIKLAETAGRSNELEKDIYAQKFLIKRPLLQALESSAERPRILLIDELDRADEPFEALLLEILSEFQITIPELGTIKAAEPPIVIITSNRTREVHDAIKRRCLYHWVDYPAVSRELEIIRLKVPKAGAELAGQVAKFANSIRNIGLFKPPGIAESIDWANALLALNAIALSPELVQSTLGVLLKYQDDIARLSPGEISRHLAIASQAAP